MCKYTYYSSEELIQIQEAINECEWGEGFFKELGCENIISFAQLCGSKDTIELPRNICNYLADIVEKQTKTVRTEKDNMLFDLINAIIGRKILQMPKKNKEGEIVFNRKSMAYAKDRRNTNFASIKEENVIVPILYALNIADVVKKAMFI